VAYFLGHPAVFIAICDIYGRPPFYVSAPSCSGAGTNLKVGGPVRGKAAEFFLVATLHFFWLQKLVILVSAFVMVSTVR